MLHRNHAIRTMIVALCVQWAFYLLVLVRGLVAPIVPSPRIADYQVFTGEQPAQRTVHITEHFGGADFSVSDSWQNALAPSVVRAWRFAPALRVVDGVPKGQTPMYARWIGITGPAWSGCMAWPDGKYVLVPTASGFAVPTLIGQWPVIVPLSPSLTWITIDWVVCLGVAVCASAARGWWRRGRGRCGKCGYLRDGLSEKSVCPECGQCGPTPVPPLPAPPPEGEGEEKRAMLIED